MQGTALYIAIAIIGGMAVPVLAAINAAYGQAIGSVHWASLTLCAVAALSIVFVWLLSGAPMPTAEAFGRASWWHFFAGCFFMIYVVSITYVAPKIGLANAIILVVVAQIFTATLIDHFGLFGAAVQALDWKRSLGIVLLIAGVALARSPSSSGAEG